MSQPEHCQGRLYSGDPRVVLTKYCRLPTLLVVLLVTFKLRPTDSESGVPVARRTRTRSHGGGLDRLGVTGTQAASATGSGKLSLVTVLLLVSSGTS